MVRSPCSHASALKKGPWTADEDEKLIDYIKRNGHENWKALPMLAGLNRCGKSCRLRWTNYLRPDIKRGKFSEEEERVIVNLHSALGNKWSRIANHLPGRTDNEIKNFWNTHIRKKLLQMGIDPNTHKPRTDPSHFLNLSQLLGAAQFGNIASPWNINFLKLQAEATQLANIQLLRNLLQMMNTKTLTNSESNSLLGSQNPHQFRGLVNGTTISNTNEPTPVSQDLVDPPLTPQVHNDFQAISNLWASCEGGFGPEGLNINCDTLSSSYGIQTEQNPLPELVSASSTSPVTSIDYQTERKGDPSNYSTGTPTSTVFEAWEKLLDDDNYSSYWNDILDLASS